MENEAFVNILEGVLNMKCDSSGDMKIFDSDVHFPKTLKDTVDLLGAYDPMDMNHWYSITEDQDDDKLESFVRLEVLFVLIHNDAKKKKRRNSTKTEKYQDFERNHRRFLDGLIDRGMGTEYIKISELMGDLATSPDPISPRTEKVRRRQTMYYDLIKQFGINNVNAKNIAKGVYSIEMTFETFNKKYKKSISQ